MRIIDTTDLQNALCVKEEKMEKKHAFVCVSVGGHMHECVRTLQCVYACSCSQIYVYIECASLPVGVFGISACSHLYLSAFPLSLPADAISTHVVTDDSRCHSLLLCCLMSFLFIN